jgi:HD-GYP domain-containing protein (c-di-GMP phosphodiesterase class II)
MEHRLKHEGVVYFRVPLELLMGGQTIDFPLAIYLSRNKTMVLRYAGYETPTSEQVRAYMDKGLKYFACPEEYYPNWLKYLESTSPEKHKQYLADEKQQAMADAGNLSPEALATVLSKEEPTFTKEEKKKVLKSISQKMVEVMNDFSSDDPRKRKAAYNECRAMTDQIVSIGIQSHTAKSVCEDLFMMKGEDIEHSSTVSTIAVIFALSCGFVDEVGLADISLAGLLHDIGLSTVAPLIIERNYDSIPPQDLPAYHRHAEEGISLLSNLAETPPIIVNKIILEHHARFGGGGYPADLKGYKIDERVQITALADCVDDLMTGRMTGEAMDPVQAFQWLKTKKQSNPAAMILSPDLFDPVYQAVMTSQPQNLKKLG